MHYDKVLLSSVWFCGVTVKVLKAPKLLVLQDRYHNIFIIMTMKRILVIAILIGLWTSCSDKKQRIVYDENPDSTLIESEILEDTTSVTVAGLPIHFDSTAFLIHPIGKYRPNKRESKVYMSSYSSGSHGLAIAYRNNYSVSGNMENLKFQSLQSDSLVKLTEMQLEIRSFTFLRSIYNSCKEQILLYSITDKDTNKNKKLDSYDVESLYISDIDGSNFKKLTPEMQELYDWEVIEIENKLYFITIEDINKNGDFEKSDLLHYYFVDLSEKERKVKEYFPVEL